MKKLADVFLILGALGWVLAAVTRFARRDLIFPALNLPAQTYLDFGWTCLLMSGVLSLRAMRDRKS